jgi:transcriptional regulator GlxA family with amidase domain
MEPTREVVVAVDDGVQLLGVTGPVDVFDAANRVLGASAYRVRLATPGGDDPTTGSGLLLRPHLALDDVTGPVDTLLVPGRLPGPDGAGDRLRRHVARLGPRAARTAAVCLGARTLAAAGLLDGRRATTHWAFARALRREFPRVTWQPERLVVRDGPVATSAGGSAGIDLALALVADDHGVAAAREAARWLVVFLRRPGGQAQYRGRLVADPATDGPLSPVVRAVLSEPAADHRLETLAARAALSPRQLTRRFAVEVGTTPARFVERARVEAARDALERGLLVEAAARRCGFGSGEVMRRAFHRVLGVGPDDYRDRFTAPDPRHPGGGGRP